jgi:signal transduction histidine kinase
VREQAQAYQTLLQDILAKVYVTDRDEGLERVRRLLSQGDFDKYFDDLLITNGASLESPGFVDLNPLGADRRNRAFPLQEVRKGIERAMRQRETLAAGGGFCVPITAGRSVVAGAWYSPITPPARLLPFAIFAIPVLISTVVFGVLAFYWIGRSVVRPLEGLGQAAARVGAGEYATRVARISGTQELDPLVDAFNSMAAKVEGHTDELQREVARATDEAARRERALLQSSRLAAIGTLAAGIAHEINNPIGGMLNAVLRLSKSPHVGANEQRYLDLVREGLGRIHRTARKVLDFSPRQIEPVPFALAAVVEGARALVDHRLRDQGVVFTADVPADLPELVGDPHEIQQVLLNAFLNSLDVLAGANRPGHIRVRATSQGEWIECAIADDGPGAAPDVLARVFDPFFSAKADPQASGLGMFISYSIIRHHGGTMTVDSVPGEGFTVTLRLPRGGDDKGRPALGGGRR